MAVKGVHLRSIFYCTTITITLFSNLLDKIEMNYIFHKKSHYFHGKDHIFTNYVIIILLYIWVLSGFQNLFRLTLYEQTSIWTHPIVI